MSESAGQAVFPSYASQNAAVTARIAEALRQGGMAVWLDQGGRTRRQRCVGSKEPRADRHVRAVRAARLQHYAVAQGRLFPAAVASRRGARAADGQGRPVHRAGKSRTSERGALVPDALLAVPWTKLPGGETPAAFGARVKKTARAARSGPVFPSLEWPKIDPGSKVRGTPTTPTNSHAHHTDDQPRRGRRASPAQRRSRAARPTPCAPRATLAACDGGCARARGGDCLPAFSPAAAAPTAGLSRHAERSPGLHQSSRLRDFTGWKVPRHGHDHKRQAAVVAARVGRAGNKISPLDQWRAG